MRKLRNLCILLILIALTLLGGTKAFLWYYTDKTAKDIQNTLPPGMFNYSGITTSLAGSTSIDNISLIFSDQNIKIEKIELKANNIFGLLTVVAKSWGSKIPNELALKLKGITIDTTALLVNKQIADMFQHPFPIPCGKIKNIGLIEYIDIGYDRIILDADLAYQKISNKRVKLDFDLNVRDASQISFSFYGDNRLIDPMGVQSDRNKKIIPEFQMTIKNNIFQEKLYNYCAKQEHKSLADYLKNLPPHFTKEGMDKETVQAFGLILSDEIINALNEYQKNPKELYIATKPKGDISFSELKAMNEQVALDLIQPTLKVNGKNIPIQFQWMTQEALARSQEPITEYISPLIQSSERLLTPINELNANAFNKRIEVHTTSGMIYKGAFRKVEGNSLHMIIHKSRGTSDLALKTDTVRLVYILSDY